MDVLCLSPAAIPDSALISCFMAHVSRRMAAAIKKRFIAISMLDDIHSINNLKILNPKIWGYKGTIYKLRIDRGAESARVLFMQNNDHDLVVLHAFLKRTRKTPKAEAEIAIRHFAAVCSGARLSPLLSSEARTGDQ